MANWKDQLMKAEDAIEALDLVRSTLLFILEGLEGDSRGPLQAARITEYINAMSLVYTTINENVEAAKLAIDRIYEASRTAKAKAEAEG